MALPDESVKTEMWISKNGDYVITRNTTTFYEYREDVHPAVLSVLEVEP